MVIEKTQIELYKVRLDGGQGWADISIDAKEKSGRIQIASDWGAWQYYWGKRESILWDLLQDKQIQVSIPERRRKGPQ